MSEIQISFARCMLTVVINDISPIYQQRSSCDENPTNVCRNKQVSAIFFIHSFGTKADN